MVLSEEPDLVVIPMIVDTDTPTILVVAFTTVNPLAVAVPIEELDCTPDTSLNDVANLVAIPIEDTVDTPEAVAVPLTLEPPDAVGIPINDVVDILLGVTVALVEPVVVPYSMFLTTIPDSLFSRAYLPFICDNCSQEAIYYPCAIAMSPRIIPVDVVVA